MTGVRVVAIYPTYWPLVAGKACHARGEVIVHVVVVRVVIESVHTGRAGAGGNFARA
jgi:hypothetical protein